MNSVVLIGRLTKDVELRRTNTGKPVASFTIAINRNFTSQDGERQADFIPCVVWNKAAENTARYCSKGSLVGVDGRLQSRTYENQDGRRVTVVEVICDSVQFIDTKNAQNQAATQQNNAIPYKYMDKQEQSVESKFGGFNSYGIMDDDLQF